jgi:hypothetical protein
MRTLTMRTRMTTMTEVTPPHPLLLLHPYPCATYCRPEVIIVTEEENPVESVLEQEVPEELEIIMSTPELEPSQPWVYTVLMRDYEESSSRMTNDLDDPTNAYFDMNEWFPEDGSNDQDCVIKSKF